MSESKVLKKDAIVAASPQQVWKAWTTREGVQGFFAPDARIELKVGGAYEILFDPDQPKGKQGSEGCKLVEVVPERRLSFSWSFPPHLPIRDERTTCTVDLEPAPGGKTRVAFCSTGWKEGKAWDEGFAYFERAWSIVFRRLEHLFAVGPVDWKNPPT